MIEIWDNWCTRNPGDGGNRPGSGRLSGVDMQHVIVTCGCTRTMSLDAVRGKGAFRCGCGTRVKISIPEYKGDTCVARARQERCAATPITDDPVPLCKSHLRQMQVANGLIRPEDLDEYTDKLAAAKRGLDREDLDKGDVFNHLQELARKQVEEDRARWAQWDGKPRDSGALVYYIRFGSRIKIGTTVNLKSRLASLPYDELLATEPGGYDVEHERHRQFADHQIKGEWFLMRKELVDFVNGLRRQKYDSERTATRMRRYIEARDD